MRALNKTTIFRSEVIIKQQPLAFIFFKEYSIYLKKIIIKFELILSQSFIIYLTFQTIIISRTAS